MTKLHIIIGSTREGRAAEAVADWVFRRAEQYGGFDVSLLDLRDWPLPMFAETLATMGDSRAADAFMDAVQVWSSGGLGWNSWTEGGRARRMMV